MSSLAKTYSLATGVPLDRPHVLEQFYPLEWPCEKIIFLHAGGGARDERGNPSFPAKIYDHYDEVIKLIYTQITKAGYKIFQIGGKFELPLHGTINLCEQTTIRQTAYLLKRGALFIGNDSMNAHIAGSVGTPMVVLYGPTDVKNHGPEWYDKDKTILLESHRFGAPHPSYSSGEKEKTINVIPPETVANSILSLLGLPQIAVRSFMMGSIYKNQVIEMIPDNVLLPDFFPQMPINLRMDYLHNEDGMVANIRQRNTAIFANKPFNLELIKPHLQRLVFCRLQVTDDITPEFAKKVVRLGAPCGLYTEETDEAKLKDLRYKFWDVGMIHSAKPDTVETFWTLSEKYSNSKLDRNINLSKLKYRSNKYIFSSKGTYISHAAWKANLPIENLNMNSQDIGNFADNPEFWKELQHYYIYE